MTVYVAEAMGPKGQKKSPKRRRYRLINITNFRKKFSLSITYILKKKKYGVLDRKTKK